MERPLYCQSPKRVGSRPGGLFPYSVYFSDPPSFEFGFGTSSSHFSSEYDWSGIMEESHIPARFSPIEPLAGVAALPVPGRFAFEENLSEPLKLVHRNVSVTRIWHRLRRNIFRRFFYRADHMHFASWIVYDWVLFHFLFLVMFIFTVVHPLLRIWSLFLFVGPLNTCSPLERSMR